VVDFELGMVGLSFLGIWLGVRGVMLGGKTFQIWDLCLALELELFSLVSRCGGWSCFGSRH